MNNGWEMDIKMGKSILNPHVTVSSTEESTYLKELTTPPNNTRYALLQGSTLALVSTDYTLKAFERFVKFDNTSKSWITEKPE